MTKSVAEVLPNSTAAQFKIDLHIIYIQIQVVVAVRRFCTFAG
jgi:hypothetical protein